VNNLAGLLFSKGDLESAEAMVQQAMASYEAKLGPHAQVTLASINNLALLLKDKEALKDLLRKVSDGHEVSLGSDNRPHLMP